MLHIASGLNGCTGHVAILGEFKNKYRSLFRNSGEKWQMGLKEIWWKFAGGIPVAQDGDWRQAVVNTVMNLVSI
jgi:hypothetical protein